MNKRDIHRILEPGTVIGPGIEVVSIDKDFIIITHAGMSYNLPVDLVRMIARTDQLEKDKDSHRGRTRYWKDRADVEKKMRKSAEVRMNRFEAETRRLTTEVANMPHLQQQAYEKSLEISELLESRGWMMFFMRFLIALGILGWSLFVFQLFAY
jgi:hypothetical protein